MILRYPSNGLSVVREDPSGKAKGAPFWDRPLWTCPRCGASFVSRNLWHGCNTNTVDTFFRDRPPALRGLFDGFVALIERCGPITVVPTKSRIAIMGRVRFAGLSRVTRDALVVQFALPEPLVDGRIERIERYARDWYGHRLRLRTRADLDDQLAGWLCKSYRLMGQQERFRRTQM
jgi:uncharacterized protein DUF5655